MEAQTPVDINPQFAASVTDRIWQDAILHFSFTGNELLLPISITTTIGMMNVERLKAQLSAYLSRPCVALVDNNMGCVRILACPEYRGIGDVLSHILGREIQIEQARASEDHADKQDEKDDRQNENKVKVPRPPNAFILYRKHHHTILKEKNPAIHNNQISVTVGNQWNNESAEVKAHYKAMADKAKREHATKYPGYQYAPRKPSEKKRRNSRRHSRTEQLDYDTPSGEDKEGFSPQNTEALNLFAASDHEDLECNIDDLLPFAEIPAAPIENYDFTDFEMGEYDQWVDVAAHAQEAAIIINTQPHGHTHFYTPIRLTNIA